MPFRNTDPDRPVIVLFRHDLRIADNGALHAAAQSGKPVVALFILDETSKRTRPIGAARKWWLHHSLVTLTASLAKLGVKLILRRAETRSVVGALIERTKADLVLWNRRYDPAGVETDSELKSWLAGQDIASASFDGHLLHEPWRIRTGDDKPYRVYSPFWRALVAAGEPRKPLPAPSALNAYGAAPAAGDLAEWQLLPTKPDWATGFGPVWQPGEDGAIERLKRFLDGPVHGYGEDRDVPGRETTSRLSPHLTHGEITPFQIWHAVRNRPTLAGDKDAEKFLKEVAWREFSWHLLFHNPDLSTENFNHNFDQFPWRSDAPALRAWQKGMTGYPIVDAGMRELWQTGWMHNRVRMVAASFLIKHLLIDWREGERWFWDTLVDADPANNPASWQWVAGSGADAAPYFRVFNPILQGEKFDGGGDYVSAFVPELAKVSPRLMHKPWQDPDAMRKAGVKLGLDYPVPVVEHDKARQRALDAYQSTREER